MAQHEAEHHQWKGDAVGYFGLHSWVRRTKGRPAACEQCGATSWVEWANLSHEYRRDLTDWVALCRSCHRKHDIATHPHASKTHCKHGHLFDEANTRITPAGSRVCRTCHREREKARRVTV